MNPPVRLAFAAAAALVAVLALAAILLLAPPAHAKGTRDWSWRGPLGPDAVVDLRGFNGSVEAVPAAGKELVVTAEIRWKDADPEQIRIEHHVEGPRHFFCAILPGMRASSPNPCASLSMDKKGKSWDDDETVEVDWRLEVPAGVRLIAKTVNGNLDLERLQGPVEAMTVNGSIEVSTDDVAEARTVNGNITARLGSGRLPHDLDFSTVNGSLRLVLHPEIGAEVRASCMNGELASDFPLMVKARRRWSQQRMEGTLGDGGALLSLSTVNGSIELARQGSRSR